MAAHLGCDPKTLRKYFSREIEAGPHLIAGEVLELTFAKARTGSVPALKLMREILAEGRIRRRGVTKDPAEDKPAAVGKKVAAEQRARDVPEDWGFIADPGEVH